MSNFLKNHKAEFIFGGFFVLLIVSMVMQGLYQNDFGRIDVSLVSIQTSDGKTLVGKLYRPIEAGPGNKSLPGVLAIHGYNNDKDVQRPHSLELAKRGVVVLAIDCLAHGDSDGNISSVIAIPDEAYLWLIAQPFVNSSLTGVVGHSLGAIYAYYLAMMHPEIDVLGYQAFGPDYLLPGGIPYLAFTQTNIIQICSSAEEFGGRLWNQTVADWKAHCEQFIASNTQLTGVDDGTGEFFKTYGSISAGTAQRYIWLTKTHPGQTHDLTATKEITSFFLQTLKGYTTEDANALVSKTTYIWADIWGASSALMLLLSIIPLLSVLLKTPQFQTVAQPMPEQKEALKSKKWVWWLFATINMAIGGAVYAFNSEGPSFITDHTLMKNGYEWWLDGRNLQDWIPGLDMAVTNAWLAFFFVNALINALIVIIWFFAVIRRKGGSSYDLGISDQKEKFGIKWSIAGKTIILAGIIFSYMYIMTAFGKWLFAIELRGPWALFKTFTPSRTVEFFKYNWGILFFWIFNAGIWLFGLMRQKEYGSEWKTVLIWWVKIVFAMMTGIILLNLINYIPVFAGWQGPILQKWTSGFAPMNLLQTWIAVPLYSVFYLIAIIYYRKTGRIWLATILISALNTWILVTSTIQYGVPILD